MALSDDDVRDRLRGVSVGLLTPFTAGGEIDYDAFESNATALYEQGIRSFLTVANISEYHSLGQDERIALADRTVGALPADACLLAGVGGSTKDASQLVRAYEDAGIDAMMVMPPDHTYIHERGLLEYYEALAEATDRPLVPYVRGFNPSIEYLADLSALDRVIGIKYAIPEAAKLGAAVEAGPDDVVWVNGMAEPMAVSLWPEGIEGFSAGVSNFRPEVGLALFDALSNENWARARRIRNICLPYQQLRGGTGPDNTLPEAISVPVVKKGLDLAGLTGGHVREPIRPLAPEDEERAETLYAELDAAIADLLTDERPA